jgi:DNA processing protein
MAVGDETASIVALLRHRAEARTAPSAALPEGFSAQELLDEELGLLAGEARQRAADEVEDWRRRGIAVVPIGEPDYPPQLRRSAQPPPLLFVRGDVGLLRQPAVAVIGTRGPSEDGLGAARAISHRLLAAGFVLISGLAAGIDTAAHQTALGCRRPTVAVIGTGVDRYYPPANRPLQDRIAASGAVVSQFWPDAGPTRRAFPMRNGVMAGLAIASVIVEASETSGTRIQARMSLASGRKVLLLSALLDHAWAREMARRPGVEVVSNAAELDAALGDAMPGRAAA